MRLPGQFTLKAGISATLVLFNTSNFLIAEESASKPTPQAASQSDQARTLYSTAIRLAKGDGVPSDPAKAAEYMRQAAELDYAPSQNDLGVYYAKGLGVPQDFEEAAKW